MSHAVDMPAAEAARASAVASAPTFEELAMQRFLARRSDDPTSYPEYREARDRFESANGRIVQEWWSASELAGAALTVPRTSLLRSAVAAQSGAHRATDQLTSDFPDVAAALHEADGLAIRCGEILRGTSQRVALTHLFGAVVSVLGVVEQLHRWETPPGADDAAREEEARMLVERVDRALAAFRADLAGAEAYYRQAAARTTQIFYFWGMMLGVVVMGVMTSLVAGLVHVLLNATNLSPDAQTFALVITAVSAGGLGACVSAMWRISSGDFHAEYEAGSTHARTIGAFRPFIGAIFGLGLYVALQAGFLPTLQDQASDFYLAAFLAFLGGFSERLAPDVFAKAEKQISGSASSTESISR